MEQNDLRIINIIVNGNIEAAVVRIPSANVSNVYVLWICFS